MKIKTPWFLVFGLVLSITLSVIGWSMFRVQAHTNPPVIQAQLPTLTPKIEQVIPEQEIPETERGTIIETSSRQAAVPVPNYNTETSLCVTCGGFYRYTAGAFFVPVSRVWERGRNCSGQLVERRDNRPRLCDHYTR